MAYREKESRAPTRFELRPAPGYWVAAGIMTLLGVSVGVVFLWGVWRHGEPSLGALVRGGAVLAAVAIFWLGTSGYRVRV